MKEVSKLNQLLDLKFDKDKLKTKKIKEKGKDGIYRTKLLTYLSWANAWKEFIKVYPTATYCIKKNDNGLSAFGDDKMGFMAYTTVTVGELTHEMWLPILDFKNLTLVAPNIFDINKTVMRCLTKNLAMFGLGLYIYAGEDIPSDDVPKAAVKAAQAVITKVPITPEIMEKSLNYLTEGEYTLNQLIVNLKKKYLDPENCIKVLKNVGVLNNDQA